MVGRVFVARTPREMAESYRRFPLVADPRSSSRSRSRFAAVQRALRASHHALSGTFVAGEVADINAHQLASGRTAPKPGARPFRFAKNLLASSPHAYMTIFTRYAIGRGQSDAASPAGELVVNGFDVSLKLFRATNIAVGGRRVDARRAKALECVDKEDPPLGQRVLSFVVHPVAHLSAVARTQLVDRRMMRGTQNQGGYCPVAAVRGLPR